MHRHLSAAGFGLENVYLEESFQAWSTWLTAPRTHCVCKCVRVPVRVSVCVKAFVAFVTRIAVLLSGLFDSFATARKRAGTLREARRTRSTLFYLCLRGKVKLLPPMLTLLPAFVSQSAGRVACG